MYVTARPNETFEELYRRFKRGMESSGILREHRRMQQFMPAHELRRQKVAKANRRKRRSGRSGE